MPLYFAYGANMELAGMAERCPRSRPLGPARLPGHRFFIMAGGFANIIRDPRASVHGLLWELALADVAALDRYEEIGRGLYRKTVMAALRQGGGPVRALVYKGASAETGTASRAYVASVIAAARALDLPAPYVSHLESFLPARERTGP